VVILCTKFHDSATVVLDLSCLILSYCQIVVVYSGFTVRWIIIKSNNLTIFFSECYLVTAVTVYSYLFIS